MSGRQRAVCGIHAVRQLLLSRPETVECVWLQADLGAGRRQRLSDVLGRVRQVREAPAGELERLAGTARHQGVVALAAEVGPLSETMARDSLAQVENPLVLVLDGVQDPRNFGACLRTADAAGVHLVVVARSRNVAITPVVSKVAAGAAEAVPIVAVGNLARFLGDLKDMGLWLVGTADDAPRSLYATDLRGGIALVLGAEGEGLRRLTRERCDYLVSLPMSGVVSSLNVAVAAGVALFECVRQRSAGGAAQLPGGHPVR